MSDVKPATAEQRAEWNRLADEATPGPWRLIDGDSVVPWIKTATGPIEAGDGDTARPNDAAFISAARDAVPALEAALVEAENEADKQKRIRCSVEKRLEAVINESRRNADDFAERGCQVAAINERYVALEQERDELHRKLMSYWATTGAVDDDVGRRWLEQQSVRARKAEAERDAAQADAAEARQERDVAIGELVIAQADAAALRNTLGSARIEIGRMSATGTGFSCSVMDDIESAFDGTAGRAIAERLTLWRELETLVRGAACCDGEDAHWSDAGKEIIAKLAALDAKGGAK